MHAISRAAVLTAVTSALVFAGAASASADSGATGAAVGSPGFLSGNVLQIPIDIPVNLCGNTVDVLALLNPTAGNSCVNDPASGFHVKSTGDPSLVSHRKDPVRKPTLGLKDPVGRQGGQITKGNQIAKDGQSRKH